MQVIQQKLFSRDKTQLADGIPSHYCDFSLKTVGFSDNVAFSDSGHAEILAALKKEGIEPDSLQRMIDEDGYILVQIGFFDEAKAMKAWHKLFDLQPLCLQF
jgi:hypothetical protein